MGNSPTTVPSTFLAPGVHTPRYPQVLIPGTRFRYQQVYPALKRALEILSDYARVQLADESIKVLVVLPYITMTKFADNALGHRAAVVPDFDAVRRNLPPAHTAEFVADQVMEALRNGATEISLAPA